MKPKSGEGRRESRAYRFLIYVILLIGVAPILLPLYWLVLGSLKPRERLEVAPPDWLPVVPRNFIQIEGRDVEVSLVDDGRTSGTGVYRVRPMRGETGWAHLPVQRILRETVPSAQTTSAPARYEVSFNDIAEQETQAVWTVLGLEIPVRCQPDPPPPQGACRIFWTERPPAHPREGFASSMIQVAPRLVAKRGAPPDIEIHWRERTLAAELLTENTEAGFITIQLLCPPDGLDVPVQELRSDRRVRRFAVIDGRRREIRVLERDAAAGRARVEIVADAPPRLAAPDAPAARIYWATLLGQTQAIEPVKFPLPDGPAAVVAVRVPGVLAVAPDHVRTEAPLRPQWRNYAATLQDQAFGLYAVNTLFIGCLVVLGTILSCGLAGYAFARLQFRGRDALFLLLLSTLMVPAQVTSIPTFVLFVKFGWIDSFKPLIVPSFLAQAAFFVFLFRQFMLTVPADLEDAARIDGCGPLATWWLILMPLSRPIVVTVAVFAFLGVWNDLLGPVLYINSDSKQTVALGLQNLKTSFYGGQQSEILMAASVMAMLPSLILFFIAQRAFLRGVVVSGVKG